MRYNLTMSVLIAGHSQVKYLHQYFSDPHISCISKPGAAIRDLFPLVQEAAGYFNVSIKVLTVVLAYSNQFMNNLYFHCLLHVCDKIKRNLN